MIGSMLILEDEAVVALEIEECLAEAGHKVVGVASCAREAAALARELRPDLLLADISIGGPIDGIETARLVREVCGADVVFLTAHRSPQVKARAAAADPLGYLVKPFVAAELAAAVEIALCRKGARCKAAEPRRPFQLDAYSVFRILPGAEHACPMAVHCVGAE